MTTTTPDLLNLLDADAALSVLFPGDVRAAWLVAIQAVNDRDGDFGSGRVRAMVPHWAHSPNSGSTVAGVVRSKAAYWTGDWEPLGNTEQRAGGRLVKVYRLTRNVWPEVAP